MIFTRHDVLVVHSSDAELTKVRRFSRASALHWAFNLWLYGVFWGVGIVTLIDLWRKS